MCSTAAVQPCFDMGERANLWSRWAALHVLGPVLVAAFAKLAGAARPAYRVALVPDGGVAGVGSAEDRPAGSVRGRSGGGLCPARHGGIADLRAPTRPILGRPARGELRDWLAGALPSPPTTKTSTCT